MPIHFFFFFFLFVLMPPSGLEGSLPLFTLPQPRIWVADHPPLRLFEPPDAVWTVPLAGAQEVKENRAG